MSPDLVPDDRDSTSVPPSRSSMLVARLLRLRPPHGPRPTGQRVRDGLDAPRWALTLGILLFIVIFLALLVLLMAPRPALGSTADGINFDRPTKDWHQGPVRYLITKQEIKAYKALETDSERAIFIDWFWQRRDIEPSTQVNEFRQRFESRVYESTRKFSATTIPGWRTDMGKIYVLVGPPDETISDMMAKTHRGIVTWIYRRPPFPDLPPNTVVAFARDGTGEFRLSSSPTLDSDVARGLKFARVKLDANERLVTPYRDPVLLDAGVSLSQQGDIAMRMVYSRMQMLPPHEEELFQGFVATKEAYGAVIPMEARFDYYLGSDDVTYVTVTVGIKSSAVQYRTKGDRDEPDVGVFGKVISRLNPDESWPLAGDSSFAASLENVDVGVGELLIYQATGAFKPGAYRVILGAEDRVSRKVSSISREIEVPDLSQSGLSLSSITLATVMEPTDYASSIAKPFQLGKFRLVPRPDSAFAQSGELNVYFQVYNPAVETEGGKPKMDVLYTFRYREVDGSYKDIGTYQVKDSTAQVHGYAVPLARWPEGQYLVMVTVVDQVAKTQVTTDVGFSITP